MKVFNVDSIKKNQRFNNALLYSIPLTIVLIIGYTIVRRLLPVEFSIIYIGFGYLIGMCIQKYGRGVTRQFSILGAVLAFLCFFFCPVFRM